MLMAKFAPDETENDFLSFRANKYFDTLEMKIQGKYRENTNRINLPVKFQIIQAIPIDNMVDLVYYLQIQS